MQTVNIWQEGLWALAGVGFSLFLFFVIIWRTRGYTSTRSVKKMEHEMSGSVNQSLMDDLLENKPLAGVYLLPKGGVLPFTSAQPEDDGSMEHLDAMSDWFMSQDAIRFILYALEREDWKREFSEWESTLEETLLIAKRAVEKDKLRKSFQLIEGGLSDNTTAGDFQKGEDEEDET